MKFKVGDKVIITFSNYSWKSEIMDINRDSNSNTMYGVMSKPDSIIDDWRPKAMNPGTYDKNQWSYFYESDIEFDKEYYRDIKIGEILGEV